MERYFFFTIFWQSLSWAASLASGASWHSLSALTSIMITSVACKKSQYAIISMYQTQNSIGRMLSLLPRFHGFGLLIYDIRFCTRRARPWNYLAKLGPHLDHHNKRKGKKTRNPNIYLSSKEGKKSFNTNFILIFRSYAWLPLVKLASVPAKPGARSAWGWVGGSRRRRKDSRDPWITAFRRTRNKRIAYR